MIRRFIAVVPMLAAEVVAHEPACKVGDHLVGRLVAARFSGHLLRESVYATCIGFIGLIARKLCASKGLDQGEIDDADSVAFGLEEAVQSIAIGSGSFQAE